MNEACKSKFQEYQQQLGKVLITYYRPSRPPVTSYDSKGYPQSFGKSQPRGVIVSFIRNGEVYFGHSLCKKKEDEYDRYLGLNIAIERARPISEVLNKLKSSDEKAIPQSLVETLSHAVGRSERAFRTDLSGFTS